MLEVLKYYFLGEDFSFLKSSQLVECICFCRCRRHGLLKYFWEDLSDLEEKQMRSGGGEQFLLDIMVTALATIKEVEERTLKRI